jgi:hypothetical protein
MPSESGPKASWRASNGTVPVLSEPSVSDATYTQLQRGYDGIPFWRSRSETVTACAIGAMVGEQISFNYSNSAIQMREERIG